MIRRYFLLLALVSTVLLMVNYLYTSPTSPSSVVVINEVVQSYDGAAIKPLPLNQQLPQQIVALGEKLFHDPILSVNNSVSCATCHQLEFGGDDNLPVAVGVNGQTGSLNSPSVFNSAFNQSQFWDGRSDTLAEQIEGPIHNPREMANNWPNVINKLTNNDYYQRLFKQSFDDGITRQNIISALVTFERSLVASNSKFDQYLRGFDDALTAEQKQGWQLFQDFGCISCHQGINIGGNMFQKLGIFKPYFSKSHTPADLGRYNVTFLEQDRFVFKVPSLRNVAVTAPYFHDGKVKNLADAIDIMAQYQLGISLSEQDNQAIQAFLASLTGEWKGKLLQ